MNSCVMCERRAGTDLRLQYPERREASPCLSLSLSRVSCVSLSRVSVSCVWGVAGRAKRGIAICVPLRHLRTWVPRKSKCCDVYFQTTTAKAACASPGPSVGSRGCVARGPRELGLLHFSRARRHVRDGSRRKYSWSVTRRASAAHSVHDLVVARRKGRLRPTPRRDQRSSRVLK